MDPNGSLANGNMARMDKDEIDKRLKIETASHPSFDTPLDVAKVAAMQAVCLAIVPEEWLHATAYRTAARARLIMYVHRQKGKSGNTSRQPPITVIAVTAACIFLFFGFVSILYCKHGSTCKSTLRRSSSPLLVEMRRKEVT